MGRISLRAKRHRRVCAGVRILHPKIDKLACQAKGESIFARRNSPLNNEAPEWVLFCYTIIMIPSSALNWGDICGFNLCVFNENICIFFLIFTNIIDFKMFGVYNGLVAN